MSRTIIHNAIIVNEMSRRHGYVAIDGEIIAEVGEGAVPGALLDGATLIDALGAYLLPGAIDTHVHFREPGLTQKADIASESAAAVAGGVTSYLEMPNTRPAATSVGTVNDKMAIAAEKSFANYAFFIGATNDNIDEILSADYTAIPGVKLFMGSSTGNMLVNDPSTLQRLFSEFKGVIAVHAEDETRIRANREWLSREYGDNAPVSLHSLLRSREACLKSSSLAVELARRHGSRLHLLHVSTADELALLDRGPIADKRVTAETCPHYLTFTAADLCAPRGYLLKCNPAIKGAADREALRAALADDRIDILATDHAPHRLADKEGSLFTAASGMPGVKFMLPLMLDLTLGSEPVTSIEKIVEKVSHNPATLYGIDRRGFVRPGYYADLVIVERGEPQAISDADASSHLPEGMTQGCLWTPYAGMTVAHRVAATIVNGQMAYDGRKAIKSHPKPLKFKG